MKYVKALENKSVRTTPFAKKGTQCVFPFLISEAKAGKSSASRIDVELQIGFQVRETLLAQESLAATSQDRSVVFEPLVWCVTYIGESVYIMAACLRWKSWEGSKDHFQGGYRTVISTLQLSQVSNR